MPLGIDLILAGHDHFYKVKHANGVTIVKSGTDFRNFTLIEIILPPLGPPVASTIKTTRYDVTTSYPEDPDMMKIIGEYKDLVASKMGKVYSVVVMRIPYLYFK